MIGRFHGGLEVIRVSFLDRLKVNDSSGFGRFVAVGEVSERAFRPVKNKPGKEAKKKCKKENDP